jgi:hypothetical protein
MLVNNQPSVFVPLLEGKTGSLECWSRWQNHFGFTLDHSRDDVLVSPVAAFEVTAPVFKKRHNVSIKHRGQRASTAVMKKKAGYRTGKMEMAMSLRHRPDAGIVHTYPHGK